MWCGEEQDPALWRPSVLSEALGTKKQQQQWGKAADVGGTKLPLLL